MSELNLGGSPRNWPPGSTWADVDGLYSGGQVVYATDGKARTNTFFHELGHAIDDYSGWLSHKKEFKGAATADRPTFADSNFTSSESPISDAYLTASGNAGFEETFAESFARHYTGDAAWDAAHPTISATWKSFRW